VLGPFVAAPGAPPGPIAPGTPLVNAPGTFPAIVNNYNLQAQVIVPIADYVFRVSQGIQAARQSTHASRLQVRAAELAIAAQARVLYYSWIRSRLTEIVTEQQVVDARTQLENVQAAEGLGRATRVDMLAAQARLAASESTRDQAASAQRRMAEELRLAMHATETAEFEIGENLEAGTRARVEPLAALYREAERKRVDLAAARAAQRAASRRTDVEKAKAYPRLDAFFNGYYANPNLRYLPPQDEFRGTWDAGVQLSWTPNDVLTTRAELRAQEAEVARLSEERQALAEALRREVLEAQEELRRVQATKGGTEARLEAAEAAYEARQEAFDLGRATFSDVITAQTEVLLARLAYVDTQVGLRMAEVRLEHAVGRDAVR
jgi:outer membrane protein TolC